MNTQLVDEKMIKRGSGSSGSGSNGNDCCEQGSKPEQITFRYIGGSCHSSTDSQESKFDCNGGSATATSVYVEVDDFFEGTVNLGETFQSVLLN